MKTMRVCGTGPLSIVVSTRGMDPRQVLQAICTINSLA